MYKVSIIEHYYEDDYENGEVDGTYQTVEIETKTFDSLKQAVAWAKSAFGGESYGEIIGAGIVLLDSKMVKAYGDHFAKPTDKDVEDWKAGKTKLWSHEYQARFEKIEPVHNAELYEIVGSSGN